MSGQSPQQHAASIAYQARLTYRTAQRSEAPLSQIGVGEIGHMLDTLKDAALNMRQVMVRPHLDPSEEKQHKIPNPAGLPDYISRYASNFLAASTFNRKDTPARVTQPKKHPDVVAFMNLIHGVMRRQTLDIGNAFVVPDSIAEMVKAYDEVIEEYRGLLKQYANPDASLNYKNIPRKVMQAYAEKFTPIADRLEEALRSLPSVELEIDGHRYSLPNDRLLNDRLEKTYPAAMLWVYRSLGHGAADHHKRPASLEYELRQRTLIGAQSMLTDTLQGLFDLAGQHNVPFQKFEMDRGRLQTGVMEYARTFQLMLNFCSAADCGYPAMFQDLERLTRMGGAGPELQHFNEPQEVALMLAAVERRFAREDKNPPLRTLLRNFADEISKCADMDEVKTRFGEDAKLQNVLTRSLRTVETAGMESALPVLTLLCNELAPDVLKSRGKWRQRITDERVRGAEIGLAA